MNSDSLNLGENGGNGGYTQWSNGRGVDFHNGRGVDFRNTIAMKNKHDKIEYERKRKEYTPK